MSWGVRNNGAGCQCLLFRGISNMEWDNNNLRTFFQPSMAGTIDAIIDSYIDLSIVHC